MDLLLIDPEQLKKKPTQRKRKRSRLIIDDAISITNEKMKEQQATSLDIMRCLVIIYYIWNILCYLSKMIN